MNKNIDSEKNSIDDEKGTYATSFSHQTLFVSSLKGLCCMERLKNIRSYR